MSDKDYYTFAMHALLTIQKAQCTACGSCAQTCPVQAISCTATHAQLHSQSCILCGTCIQACSHSAITVHSHVEQIAKLLAQHIPLVALTSPALAVQMRAQNAALKTALLRTGFCAVYDVADSALAFAQCAAKEFEQRIARGQAVMTTSCCPAYTQAVHVHIPALCNTLSHTATPLHFAAKRAKQEYPVCKTVFIGPCLAKHRESTRDSTIDFVLQLSDICTLFKRTGIQLEHTDTAYSIYNHYME